MPSCSRRVRSATGVPVTRSNFASCRGVRGASGGSKGRDVRADLGTIARVLRHERKRWFSAAHAKAMLAPMRFALSFPAFCVLSFTAFASFTALQGCGGAGADAKGPTSASNATGTSTASAPLQSAIATLGPLPSVAQVPDPGVRGSKKAALRLDATYERCQRSVAGDGKDLARDIERIANACAQVTKQKPLGELLRGTVDDAGPAKSFTVRFQKGHCYRMYSASSPSVKSIVLSLRDSDGGTILDTHTDVAPADGALCFSSDDAATLLVASGNGKGEIVVRVYGD